MKNKLKAKIKVIRNGEPVNPQSTNIRTDQVERLKMDRPPQVRTVGPSEPVKLSTRSAKQIYTTGKMIECVSCKKVSPTIRMFIYDQSSHGMISLCEQCDERAEVRSFYKLDALDKFRKKSRVE